MCAVKVLIALSLSPPSEQLPRSAAESHFSESFMGAHECGTIPPTAIKGLGDFLGNSILTAASFLPQAAEYHVFKGKMGGRRGRHGRRDAQRLMNAAEIVGHEMQRDGMPKIL